MPSLSPYAVAAALLALVACGGGSPAPRASGTPAPTATRTSSGAPRPISPAPSLPGTHVPSVGVPTDVPSTSVSAVASESAPPRATYDLSVAPSTCSYVPNGSVDGRDLLNVGAYVVLVGSSGLDRLVPVRVTSDTGLLGSTNAQARNRGETIVGVPLRDSDFGRTHRLTVTLDPGNEFPETDEGNNTMALTVTLPSPRPTSVIDPLTCR